MADDEVQALQGIFCGDGEFEMLQSGDECRFSICVTCQPQGSTVFTAVDQSQEESVKISMQCCLPIGYPDRPPAISLACDSLTKHSTNQLQEKLHEHANSLLCQPMIMELVYWLQENGTRFTTKAGLVKQRETSSARDRNALHATILHIDHMRSRVRYVKTLVSWASELALIGRLLFLHQLIVVVLIGNESGVKDFLVRLRTQKVDIDSNGRSCKERMMTVLMHGPHPSPSDETRFDDFRVQECSTSTELEDIFMGAGLLEVYKNAVLPKFPHLQRASGRNVSKR